MGLIFKRWLLTSLIRLNKLKYFLIVASQIGMSRAVFHRKFKQATNMPPKSMRLNHAAMKITQGTNVNVAAMEMGYVSSSQFSREFKRMYGLSPKQ
nr:MULTISPECIES: helix-turn-helix transcriptional regulator [unclassified Pseudoalteromonas]